MEEVLYIIIGVGSAINVLHKNGVVHNDIKTDNVLLEIDYQNLTSPKLIDFGVSNVFNNNILKVAGMPLEEKKGLSIPYSAPERIAPKSVTSGALAKKGDIYSFGILMYELITEKDPWTAETRVKDLRKNRI